MTRVQAGSGWLLVTVVSGSEATLRVRVWRDLRKIGAVYLHNSVCLLPDQPAVAAALEILVRRVHDGGGRARVFHTQLLDSAEEAAIIAEQVADRDREYNEVIERTGAFVDEIARETSRGNATYTEVEEYEADLERFERWLASIAARDYFGATGRANAEAALRRCRDLLADFQLAVLAADAESLATETDGPGQLRLVRGDE
jgi:uncharacterized protein YdbL (DUF1318 family)